MKLIVISNLVLFFGIAHCQPVWDDKLDHEALELRLSNEAVIDQISLDDYFKKRNKEVKATHPIKVITLKSGLKGIFKKGEYHYAEVAAYRMSKALGLRLVPPTVFKTVNGVQGSLQFLVENECECSLKKLDPKSLSDMKLFYYIVGQWDTHRGNQIITNKNGYHIALIDNSVILHRSYSIYGGPLFIEKGINKNVPSDQSKEFPFHKAQKIERDTGEQGPKGDRGATGPQGAQGQEGARGKKGQDGATGPQGPVGPQGPKGSKGATGEQGPKGDRGATGSQGERGPKGDHGKQGATGAEGPEGKHGKKGSKGNTGEQGPKGDRGATGSKGEQGSDIYYVFRPYLTKAHIKELRHVSLSYVLWKDTLWFSWDSVNRHAKKIATSTLEALKNLTEDDLRLIWAEWYQIEPEHAEELIQLTLQRRDEVLKSVKPRG